MNILVVGDIIVDIYTYGTCDRLAPDFVGLVFDELKHEYYLGGAGNVAKNIKALLPDAEVSLMGSIDMDKWQHPKHMFEGLNIISISSETMIKQRYVTMAKNKPGQPRWMQKLFRTDNIKRFSTEIQDTLRKDYDFVVISDYNKGSVSPLIKIQGSPTVLLDSKRKDISGYSFANIVKINDQEYEASKATIHNENVIVTNGPDPVDQYYKGNLIHQIDTYDIPVSENHQVDHNGAGDTFLAGMVYGLSKGNDITTSIKIANIASAISITRYGTSVVDSTDLESHMFMAKVKGYLE